MMTRLIMFREAWAWLDEEERLYRRLLGDCSSILHLFSGESDLGDVRIDVTGKATHRIFIKPHEKNYKLPFSDASFDAVIADPPWFNQYFIWLSREAFRLARKKVLIITDRWFIAPSPPYNKTWRLDKIYVVKRVSPLVKLVFLYKNTNKTLESLTMNG